MPSTYTYALILIASLAIPLALSFDKKVAFYKHWKYIFPAMIAPAIIYIVWDVFFTKWGVWSFNPKYTLGIDILGLPLEEILFFFFVPYCCMFIYVCYRTYFPKVKNRKIGDTLLQMIGVLLLLIGIFAWQQRYTSHTFLALALVILWVTIWRKKFHYFSAYYFLVAFCIILIPFLIVNGVLTYLPVVIYNNAENLNTRIVSIPVEDIFYGMLLILLNVLIYEKLQDKFGKVAEVAA